MKYIKLFFQLMLAIVLSIIAFVLMFMIVACWMHHGGWGYLDHKIFFWCFTLGPSLALFSCLIYEIILDNKHKRFG